MTDPISSCTETPASLVKRQAEDEGLWFQAQTAPEAYLQAALRELHAAVEAAEAGITELLAALDAALTDWVQTYAAEHCDPENVAESVQRIADGGGTLAYIADLRMRVRNARVAAPEGREGATLSDPWTMRSEQLDAADCIIARLPCCGSIIFATVIARAASGLSIEHMTASEVRKQKWGCKCAVP